MKFYRGSASAARSYVEADRSRVDDYYLAEGTGVATRYVATTPPGEGGPRVCAVQDGGTLDGDTYELWVVGYDVTSEPKGRLRKDDNALRFVELVVNGPKTWSLAATLHPEIAAAYDLAQDRAVEEMIGWLAEHATTRVGPRGRQVQVPVEQLKAAVVRHYASRAGDPHRHLHLQINARVFAAGAWRGLHSVGVVDSIEALNGIGHAAVACDPAFRGALAAHGYTLDPDTGEVAQLAAYAGVFSARVAQITANIDRLEATWRSDHPGEGPGPTLRRAWDRRAWSQARPDKVVPTDGADLNRRWVEELHEAGFTCPTPNPLDVRLQKVRGLGTAIGWINRDEVADLAVSRLGARRSSWNAADICGEVEKIIAALDVVAARSVRSELAEDLTHRTLETCVRLLPGTDVPGHVRAWTSPAVLDVEADLVARLVARADHPSTPGRALDVVDRGRLDLDQRRVVAALAGTGKLLVIEGAAGAGKTTTLAAARELLELDDKRLVVVTPTLKAARVAKDQVGTDAFSAAWLIHQHGFRWDTDGHRTRTPPARADVDARARLLPGDVLLVDEAGMLDQDTAQALLTIADEAGVRVAFVGDRHQLPAVGRGGVLDHAARWAHPEACLTLESVHRFGDPEYADLTLLMRTGERAGEVFDNLLARGEIRVHPTQVEATAALAALADEDGLVIADTRDQVATLNTAIRDHRNTTTSNPHQHLPTDLPSDLIAVEAGGVITAAGVRIGTGDRVTTRRNDRSLDVANRDTWTVTRIGADGGLTVTGPPGERTLPPAYVHKHVELAYATTVYGAQGATVDQAHLLVGETTGTAAAYVGMTRGRHHNTAHLVADTLDQARAHWVDVFARDRADLGPAHAGLVAAEDIDRYGTQPPTRTPGRSPLRPPATPTTGQGYERLSPPTAPAPSRGISY